MIKDAEENQPGKSAVKLLSSQQQDAGANSDYALDRERIAGFKDLENALGNAIKDHKSATEAVKAIYKLGHIAGSMRAVKAAEKVLNKIGDKHEG